jgi:hypothetical protein
MADENGSYKTLRQARLFAMEIRQPTSGFDSESGLTKSYRILGTVPI